MNAACRLMGGAVALLVVVNGAADVRAQDDDARRQAGEHFSRGMEFFNEGRHDAALAEFQRAYELAPAHQVLYNLGRVHEALGHAVEAADTYERYLREAGASVGAERRREVERALARQRARIAELVVRTNVAGATVSIDGVDVATTPLEAPLRLAAGEHAVGARAAGYDSLRRAVRLAGGDRQTLELELEPLVDQRGILRIVCPVPDVEVRLGDRVLGRTPLASTVPVAPGTHMVVGTRPGYREERVTIQVEHGSETEVRLDMQTDAGAAANAVGQLRIHLPDAPAVVRIDGEPMILSGGGITLPSGRHHVTLQVAEREPWETSVDVPPSAGIDLTPDLLWTPAARAERMASAGSTRTWGMVVTIGGGLVLLGGGGVFVWNESEISQTDSLGLEKQMEYRRDCAGSITLPCQMLSDELAAITEDQNRQNTIRTVSTIVAAAGAVITVVGVVLWLGSPSEESIDADAHASGPSLHLRAGPGSLSLEGRF